MSLAEDLYGSEPLSVRDNNPGNMKQNGVIASYNTPEEGLDAMHRDLALKVAGKSPIMKSRYGNDYQPTIRNVVSTWAPPTENNTDNYVNFVSQHSGLDPDSPLSPQDVPKIMQPMVHMEGGQKASNYFGKLMGGIGDAIISPAEASEAAPVSAPLDLASDLYGEQPAPSDADNDFLGRTAKYARQGIGQVSASVKNMESSADNAEYSPLEDVMNIGGGAYNTITAPIKSALQPLVKSGATSVGVSPDKPELNEQAATVAGDITNLLPFGTKYIDKGMDVAGNALGKVGDRAAAQLERPPGVFPKAAVPPEPVFDPLTYHQDINANYIAAKTDASKMYNFTEKMAAGKPAENVPEIGKSLSNIINDVESDPLHEGRSALGKLKLLQDKIDQGDFDLSDAMDLKKTLNTYFNPKRLSQSTGDVPYLRLGKTLDTSLGKSAEIYPDFGMAKELSDKNWLNTVKKPFEDNPVLNKFWKPEDYYNHNSVESGMLDFLPDETTQRMGSMVKNIKNPSQLDAITRVASEDNAAALRAAKLKDITQGQATSRLGAAGKAVGNLLSTPLHPIMGPGKALVNAGKVFTGPEFTAEQQALIKATKMPSPKLSNYGEQFDELQSVAGKPKMTVLGQKTLPAPEETLALPAPDRPIIGGRSKTPRLVTDEEWQQLIDLDNKAKELGLPLDVRKAQQAAKISEYERENPVNTFFNKIGNKPIRPSQTALHPETGDVRKLFPDEEGFKKGGTVRKKNLTAEFLAKARK